MSLDHDKGKVAWTAVWVVVIGVALIWALTPTPVAAQQTQQQPAAGAQQGGQPGQAGARGGRGGGGGGFRQPAELDFNDHDGWTQIFDGTSLDGWSGNPEVWHLEDGAIVAESTPENPTGTTYVHWTGGRPRNFELKLELKLENGGNIGVQYRSDMRPPGNPGGGGQRGGAAGRGGAAQGAAAQGAAGQQAAARGGRRGNPNNAPYNLGGYQYDFDYRGRYPGQLYENGRPPSNPDAQTRGIITYRGQVVQMVEGKQPRIVASVGDNTELKGYMNIDDWNQVHIIAQGPVLIHILNGHVMSISLDEDPTIRKDDGLIALQIEGTGKVSYRDIWLREW